MPVSQFNSPATLDADGIVHLNGRIEGAGSVSNVEIRFMVIQNNVVVEGKGVGRGSGWSGTTDRGGERLQAGPALAIGLAVLAWTEGPRGYETFTWSAQIELKQQ
jgi:hypothetical protein